MIYKVTLAPILAVAAIVGSAQASSDEYCKKNPIFCQIISNSPNLDKNYALELSDVIYHSSKSYRVDKHLLAAILMQESSYKLDANNNDSDFGIAQINVKTVKSLKLNKNLLMTDLKYSVDAGAGVLKWFSRTYKKKEPETWYCRFNVGTRKSAGSSQACKSYIKAVNRWL